MRELMRANYRFRRIDLSVCKQVLSSFWDLEALSARKKEEALTVQSSFRSKKRIFI